MPLSPQGRPSETMSTGGAGVKVTVPLFPVRGMISTKTVTPNVAIFVDLSGGDDFSYVPRGHRQVVHRERSRLCADRAGQDHR